MSKRFLAILLVTLLVFAVVIPTASAAPTSCSKCGASIKTAIGDWETTSHKEKTENGKVYWNYRQVRRVTYSCSKVSSHPKETIFQIGWTGWVFMWNVG